MTKQNYSNVAATVAMSPNGVYAMCRKIYPTVADFNGLKKSTVFEPRTGQIFEDLRLRDRGQGLKNMSSRTSSRPRTSSRTPPLDVTWLDDI